MSSRKYQKYDPSLKFRARQNRSQPSEAESRMWIYILSKRKTGYKFLRQKPIGRYIVDFYCAELQLAIELDGDSHAYQIEYDKMRTRFLSQKGILVIRYDNLEVVHQLEGVYNDLMGRIEVRKMSLLGAGTNPLNPP